MLLLLVYGLRSHTLLETINLAEDFIIAFFHTKLLCDGAVKLWSVTPTNDGSPHAGPFCNEILILTDPYLWVIKGETDICIVIVITCSKN